MRTAPRAVSSNGNCSSFYPAIVLLRCLASSLFPLIVRPRKADTRASRQRTKDSKQRTSPHLLPYCAPKQGHFRHKVVHFSQKLLCFRRKAVEFFLPSANPHPKRPAIVCTSRHFEAQKASISMLLGHEARKKHNRKTIFRGENLLIRIFFVIFARKQRSTWQQSVISTDKRLKSCLPTSVQRLCLNLYPT